MGGGPPEEEAAERVPAAEGAESRCIYLTTELTRELRQSEIITGLRQFIPDPVAVDEEQGGEFITHPFAIVLSQDCDLLQDFNRREKGEEGALPSVLLYAAQAALDVRADIKGKDIWKRIIQNNDERYHLLESAPSDCDLCKAGIDSLIIDFKSFFTLTPKDIHSQCAAGTAKRRCRLAMPYREHIQCRAAFYFQRIVLPDPHKFC